MVAHQHRTRVGTLFPAWSGHAGSHVFSGENGMHRRAFTIIELMIVLVLVLALTAIAMPSLWARVGKERGSAFVRAVADTATDCRTRAMRTGMPIAMVVVPEQTESGDGARTTWTIVQVEWDAQRPDAWMTVIEASAASDSDELLDAAFFEDEATGEREPMDVVLTVPERWLPFGADSRQMLLEQAQANEIDRGSARGALSGDASDGADVFASTHSGIGGLGETESIGGAIVVFLPDGSALPGPVSVFSHDDHRLYDVVVGRWSGVVSLEPAQLEDEESPIDFDGADPAGGREP